MAINRVFAPLRLAPLGLALLLVAATATSREAASPTDCAAAAATPAIAGAKAEVADDPEDLQASFKLADAWSDAGCFNDAVQVLQKAEPTHAGSKELATRLRVARSLVGEAHFFDNLDRADAAAKLKRDTFRCNTLHDAEACRAVQHPDTAPEPPALSANGQPSGAPSRAPASSPTSAGATSAAMTSSRDASTAARAPSARNAASQRLASTVAPDTPRRYSNVEPDTRSH